MEKQGDDGWLASAYVRDRQSLFRLARLLTGSDSIAEEMVQEAFARLHESRRVPENPGGYLRTTVVNLCRNRMRRSVVEGRFREPARLLVGEPELDETWSAISRLSPRQRAVIVLRFYEDMSEAEIAATLAWPRGTVKSRLHRALGHLRKELTNE